MEQVQHLGEFTSDERGESPEAPAPYLEELTNSMTRTIHDSAGGASYTSGISSHNLTSKVAGDSSQGANIQLEKLFMVQHGSEPLEFPMPVCGTEIKIQPTTVPQMARSTESGMGNVVVKGSIDPGRSTSPVVAREHIASPENSRVSHFSTEATVLAGDHSGSRANVSTVGQPPTATGAGSLNPSLRDQCVNPGSVATALSSRNGESSGTQEWKSSQIASTESGDTGMMLSVTRLLETQRLMMAAQVQAMAAQSVPPLRKFSGEDIDSDEGSIDRWIEQFEERAKVMG